VVEEIKPNEAYNAGRELGEKLYRQGYGIKSKETKKDTNVLNLGLFSKLQISKDSVDFYYNLSDSQLDSVLTKKGISTFYSNKKHIKFGLKKQYDKFLQDKYGILQENKSREIIDSTLPNLIFLMLPLAALILYFFERHTKWRFYFQHLVFTLNTHSAVFLMWTISDILEHIFKYCFNTTIESGFYALLPLGLGLLYFLISLKNVYLQGWGKTILKFSLLTISYIITFFFLMIGMYVSGLIQV
jgi:hypothetical protein